MLEGSNDNKNWETIDAEEDCDLIKGVNKSHTFQIENPYNKSYKFIRMTQTKCWDDGQSFVLDSIEFYGYLILNE